MKRSKIKDEQHRGSKNMRGFTLIEAVLSVAILGAGLVGLLEVYKSTMGNALLVDQTTIALNLAEETMEKIIAQKDCTKTGCGYAPTMASVSGGTYNANPVSGFNGYVLTTTGQEVSGTLTNSTNDFTTPQSGSGYYKITVRVAFNNSANYVQLNTLVASF